MYYEKGTMEKIQRENKKVDEKQEIDLIDYILCITVDEGWNKNN